MRRPTSRAGPTEPDPRPRRAGEAGRGLRWAERGQRQAGRDQRQAGYTYVSVLAVLAVMAVAAQTTWIPSRSERLRDAEAELLFRGDAYRRAVASYWAAGGADPRLPSGLDDLLDDPREPGRRHIRRLYDDPLGGGWTLLYGEDGGIAGVASSSPEAPRRRAFFPPGYEAFEEAGTYADWEFRFEP